MNKNSNTHRLLIFLLALFLSLSTSLAGYSITNVYQDTNICDECESVGSNPYIDFGFPQGFYKITNSSVDTSDVTLFVINTVIWFILWLLIILIVNYVIKRIKKASNATL